MAEISKQEIARCLNELTAYNLRGIAGDLHLKEVITDYFSNCIDGSDDSDLSDEESGDDFDTPKAPVASTSTLSTLSSQSSHTFRSPQHSSTPVSSDEHGDDDFDSNNNLDGMYYVIKYTVCDVGLVEFAVPSHKI